MKKTLSVETREQLRLHHRQARNSKVRDRIKAVLMHDDGYAIGEIARVLLIDDETVRRHLRDYFERRKLRGESGGAHYRLSSSQTDALLLHLQQRTYRYVKDICAYVRSAYGVRYGVSGMTAWLKRHTFRYKKPQPVPGKVVPEAQRAFIETYTSLTSASAASGVPIYFVDSVHPQHQTRLAYGWIKRGLRKTIATTGKQKRLSVIGGLCLKGHRLVVQQSERVDAHHIQSFLKRLRSKHRAQGPIHVIWDNAGYHCSKVVRAYAEKLAIELHYLPPYSPNLNPIERLWKVMHEQVTYNRYYETFAQFTEAIRQFFRTIGRKKKLLRSRISDNFQIVDRPNFAF